jgi:uncharacterized repeat protein (TIGR03803 family)
MHNLRFSISPRVNVAALITVFLSVAFTANAQERVLVSFNGTTDAGRPHVPVVMDAAGNLYGTAPERGPQGAGAAFQLSPDGSGAWSESLLYSFGISSVNGAFPSSGVLLDAPGNLYGVTYQGGDSNVGTVYELSPDGSGGFTETVLYSFKNDNQDGAIPYGNLTMDSAGNLFGTTSAGGTSFSGTVYELKHQSTGWQETVLYSFKHDGLDAHSPVTGLTFDAAGNLYGVTSTGGANTGGTVYQLAPQPSGEWIERVIHNFNATGTTGTNPVGRLTVDSAGNLYGTTYWGGLHSGGTFFEMKRKGGAWMERELYSFSNDGIDGIHPHGGLVFDASGNLYGTTFEGGAAGKGTLFRLSPHKNGIWTETVLHNFRPNGTDGTLPDSDLIMDAAGNLYGTTSLGGTSHGGTVFEFTP